MQTELSNMIATTFRPDERFRRISAATVAHAKKRKDMDPSAEDLTVLTAMASAKKQCTLLNTFLDMAGPRAALGLQSKKKASAKSFSSTKQWVHLLR